MRREASFVCRRARAHAAAALRTPYSVYVGSTGNSLANCPPSLWSDRRSQAEPLPSYRALPSFIVHIISSCTGGINSNLIKSQQRRNLASLPPAVPAPLCRNGGRAGAGGHADGDLQLTISHGSKDLQSALHCTTAHLCITPCGVSWKQLSG